MGKSPLYKSLLKFFPKLMDGIRPLVAYHCRKPRPQEKEGVDYYFRSRAFMERLRSKKDFVVTEVRGDLTAIDMGQLVKDLAKSSIIFEGNPLMGRMLLRHRKLQGIKKVNAFLSPLSLEEIHFLFSMKDKLNFEEMLTEIMRKKLLRRTIKQKGILSMMDLENIEVRAKSAYREVKEAVYFDQIIVNHDGEDSDNWDAFYFPIGDARRALNAFTEIIRAGKSSLTEKWPRDLFQR